MCDYIGLDVSVELTHICVVDSAGSVMATGVCRTDPAALAAAIRELSGAADLVVLETGGQSAWLQQGLEASGLNAVIVDARQAKKALSARINKTDAHDAGINGDRHLLRQCQRKVHLSGLARYPSVL